MSIINFENIPLEIQQLATELYNKIQQQCPGFQLTIDNNGPQFINALPAYEERSNIMVENNHNQRPLTEFETKIIEGIAQIPVDSEQTDTPPRYLASEFSLVMYNDFMTLKQFTTMALYFEIGRIIKDLTNGMTIAQRTTEAQWFIQQCVSSQNPLGKAYAAIRIHDYFEHFTGILNYKRIDRIISVSQIGKLSHAKSDSLKEQIITIFELLAQNSEEVILLPLEDNFTE